MEPQTKDKNLPGYAQQPYPVSPELGFVNPQYDPSAAGGSSSFTPAQGPPIPIIIKPGNVQDTVIQGMPDDDGANSWAGFSDKAIRQGFIRKVYAILMVQLAFTFALTALFVFEHRVKDFVQQNMGMYLAAYIVFFVVYIMLICSKDLRRQWPSNFILLAIFTACMSYMVATISSFHDTKVVLVGAGITAACCLAITVFSFNTKYDLTSCAGFLFVSIWILFIFGIMCIFMRNEIMTLIYATLGAALFMLFLAYDTQMVMGGKKYEISPEEHIYAALQLYMDIVQIFLYILMILGGGRK